MIAVPLASAEACCIAAYSMLKCQKLFQKQCWSGSMLSLDQRKYADMYPKIDFHFWVKYGSWSSCRSCGSYFFNDKYFKEQVYRDVVTSTKCDHMAPFRRMSPSDPLEHKDGNIGISSRWWYLPGIHGGTLESLRLAFHF